MKNDIKLQILVSQDLYNGLVEKILKLGLEEKKPETISNYVRNLIDQDINNTKYAYQIKRK